MDRNTIMKLAREHDLHCYGSITEQSLYSEILIEFAAAIRAATKEEDAKICEEYAASKPSYKEYENNYSDGWLDACNECSWDIRASK